jgi:hypothetical protein
MTALSRGFGFAIDVVTSGAWALAAFFIGARLFSFSAGLLLALGVFITSMTYVVVSRAQERRAEQLAAGRCPRCQNPVAMEHIHRRWDPGATSWLLPSTLWRCGDCGFQHVEALACESCPAG